MTRQRSASITCLPSTSNAPGGSIAAINPSRTTSARRASSVAVTAALAHLGRLPDTHDAALFNRLTGATYATHLALVEPCDTVVGVSSSYSHASVVRAAAHSGATLVDTSSLDYFTRAMGSEASVS